MKQNFTTYQRTNWWYYFRDDCHPTVCIKLSSIP